MKSGRLKTLALLFLIGYMVLFFRLFYLQIVKGDYYRKISEKNHIRVQVINPPRGKIYDRNGILLAYDEPSFQIYTYPYMVKKRLKFLKDKLKNVLGIELEGEIYERLKKGYANKVVLKKRLTQKQVKKFINHWQDALKVCSLK
ncbi:MAG: penicillin-binding protein 2, partial [Persephonella sp.]|nr:penicillin-binding protein 2 [Persephonella sp.]